jgi:hypothetical protein
MNPLTRMLATCAGVLATPALLSATPAPADVVISNAKI